MASGRDIERSFLFIQASSTATSAGGTPPRVKSAAEAAAKEDARSLSSYLEKLLTDHLRKQGFLKK